VVLATGGTAFASRLLGSATNTGDGLLMGVEAGADLSGMEFTNYYTPALVGTNMARSMAYSFARWFDADDHELDIPNGPDVTPHLARALLKGPLFCRLDRVPEDVRAVMPQVQPNFVLPFQRLGIDAYNDRFEVTLHAEGTVRGIGGLRVEDEDCQTAVPGLYVAGDNASRELVTGAISGGGNVNSAWALSSGLWSGRAAAARARRDGRRSASPAQPAGQAALRPLRHGARVDRAAAVAAVQRALLDYDRNVFRDAAGLLDSQARIEAAWRDFSDHAHGGSDGSSGVTEQLRLRETAALLANARWSVSAALRREESRGMHQRTDAPATRPEFAHRIAVGGLQQLWHRADAVPTSTAEALEAAA